MNQKHERRKESILVAIAALTIFGLIQYSGVAERWNFVIYDYLQSLNQPPLNEDIAIIVVDEKSLEQIGIWPWSRSIHAELLARLDSVSPKVVAFDILFTDSDSRYLQGDAIFSQALEKNGRSVLPVLHVADAQQQQQSIVTHPPIAILGEASAQLAHVDAEIDSDGLVRSVFLRAGVGQSDLSALGLAALEVASGHRFTELPGIKRSAQVLSSPRSWIRDNHVLLSLNGAQQRFNVYSYTDVITNNTVLEKLHNKIIFVGVTAVGVGTNLPIARLSDHGSLSSVYFHSTVADALQNNTTVSRIADQWIYSLGSFIIVLSIAVYCLSKPNISLLATVFFISVTVVISFALLKQMNLWFPPAALVVTHLISYPLWGWRRMVVMTRQLSQEKQQAEVTLNSIADGVIAINQDGKVHYMNPVAEHLTGISNQDALNQPVEAVFNVVDSSTGVQVTHKLLQYLQRKNRISPHERFILAKNNGSNYTIRTTVGNIPGSRDVKSGMVLAFSDVTETTNLLDQMSHQATHDTLTSLANRALLMERLNHSLAFAQRNQTQVALLFIDVDKFKKVNDGFGHEIGDHLLREFALRLRRNIREEDTAARLGGDEFVVVLDQITKSSSVARVTQKILANLELPYRLRNHEFFVTCSVGISIFPRDASDADTLLKNADIAMYSAKERGRNNFQYFSASMNEIIQSRLVLEKELRKALENNQLTLHYQPQFNIATKKIIGVEALLRWNHQQYGNVPPSKFIPLAEDTGLIVPIGEWVFKTACAQLNSWQQFIDGNFTVAVNLSPRQFLGQDVLSMLQQTLAKENIDAKYLKLEITEGLFVAEKTNVETTLEEFRRMGGTVSIDDFGTGYSSLSYLKRIPVDQVKIDRVFVQDITENSRGCSLIKAIISMAHDLDLDIIAEGVETAEQLSILESQRCHNIQGFYFSPAVEGDKVTELLKQEKPFAEYTEFYVSEFEGV